MAAPDSSESPPDDQELENDLENDPNDANGPPAKRQKRSRACQACRTMKIRCLPVEGQEACRACAKVNRACIMPGPARKRQKTVHKVAELEKKIDALTASLAAKNSVTTVPTPPTDSPATTSSGGRFQPSLTRVDKEYSLDQALDKSYPHIPVNTDTGSHGFEVESMADDYEDVITRGAIDEATATKIYEHWKTNMCVHCPIVAFPDKVNVEWLRRKRPMTLLAIFAIGGGMIIPELQPDLAVEMARQLADRVLFLNEKSLDLVHAMLLYSNWYGKHKFAKDLGFNNYVHLCVAMCLDLGLGKRSRQQTYSDPEDAELRRTWMGCYFMAGSVSTVLRLPSLVKFSPYMEECLESFKNHPGALPSDTTLCCLVKLTHLAQEVGLLFHMDDPGSTIRINDSSTQYQLKLFERRLEELIAESRSLTQTTSWKQAEAVLSLYIHEIAIHNEHNVDDFRPMYRASGLSAPDITKDFLTNAHFESLTICVDAMQHAIEAFLEMDADTIRGSPAMIIVWTAYVVVAMIRLHGVLAVPDSKYGNIFLPKLNVIGYLDAVINKLHEVVADAVNMPAESFIVAFKKLKAWHIHRTMVQQQRQKQHLSESQTATTGSVTQGQTSGETYGYDTCPPCPMATQEPARRISTASSIGQQGSPRSQIQLQQSQQQNQLMPHFQPSQLSQVNQTFQQQQQMLPMPSSSSALLDPNMPIDASTFDIQNWDLNVGELNNFETYLNDAGWMGYLM